MAITLPEITIVGRSSSVPVTAADWFAEGFSKGWSEPDAKHEPPAPLNKDTLAAYYEGLTAGSNARRGIEVSIGNNRGSGIEPDIGGEIFEEVEREYRERWERFIEHDDPHNEIELPEIEFAP
jgi:hypothetical protein